MLCELAVDHGCCCKMQLRKSQENPAKTVELYLGLIKITLNVGTCVLITKYQAYECDWLIMNTATSPAINGWEHSSNQVIVICFFYYSKNSPRRSISKYKLFNVPRLQGIGWGFSSSIRFVLNILL